MLVYFLRSHLSIYVCIHLYISYYIEEAGWWHTRELFLKFSITLDVAVAKDPNLPWLLHCGNIGICCLEKIGYRKAGGNLPEALISARLLSWGLELNQIKFWIQMCCMLIRKASDMWDRIIEWINIGAAKDLLHQWLSNCANYSLQTSYLMTQYPKELYMWEIRRHTHVYKTNNTMPGTFRNTLLSSTGLLTHSVNLVFHIWLWLEEESPILPYSLQPFILKRIYTAQVIKCVSQPASCLVLEPGSSGFAHHALFNTVCNR